MSVLDTMRRGLQASVTFNNMSVSEPFDVSSRGIGKGLIELVNNQRSTYAQIYERQLWVHICVNKLARGVGRIPLKAYTAADMPGARSRVRDGALADVLRRPGAAVSPGLLKAAIVGNVGVYGNMIAVKVRPGPGRPPSEVIPSSFAYWTVEASGEGRPVDWWIFHGKNGARIPFRPEEVMHFGFWGPGRGPVSPSPLEPLRRTLIVEDAAQRTQIASYEHGHRPVGAVSVDKTLRPDAAERMRDQLRQNYGGVDNAFKVMLLEAGAEWLPFSTSLVDAEVINARKLTREEVAALYDIPPPLIGILDRATFSNITEQHLMLYGDTMGPWLTMIEEAFQLQLIDEEPVLAGQYVEFDLNEVLKGDVQKRFDAYAKAQWWMTPNEVRERENLPPIQDDPRANSIHVPLNLGPVGPADRDASAASGGVLEEVRCRCGKLLGRNVSDAELKCGRCDLTTIVSGGSVFEQIHSGQVVERGIDNQNG